MAVKESEREAQRKIDSLQQQLTLKGSEMERATSHSDNLQAQVKTLEGEITQLRNILTLSQRWAFGGTNFSLMHVRVAV